MVSYKGIISIVSIVIFAPSWLLAIGYLVSRSFGNRTVWMFLVSFCLLRLIGDSLQLASEQPGNATNRSLLTGAAICNAIGLGPLFLATTGLLLQCNDFIHTKAVPNQTHRALVTFNMCTVVATVIAIVGGVQSFKHIQNGFHPTTTFEAAIGLYAATYVCIASSAAVIAFRTRRFKGLSFEKRKFVLTIHGIQIALLLLCVRVIYALLFTFDRNQKFSPFNGDETITLCMQNLEEWLIILIFCGIGAMMLKVAPPAKEVNEKEMGGTFRQMARYVPFVHWCVK